MPQSLPTPDTGTGRGLFDPSSSRRGYFPRPDETPTPHRFRAGEDGDLPSTILSLLRGDGVVLKSSTESAIRYLIEDRLAVYEARLQKATESINTAYNKLDELEPGGGSAVPDS